MSKLFPGNIDVLIDRAQEADIPIQPPVLQTPSMPTVYSGTMPPPTETASATGYVRPPQNRKVALRKVSTFNVILLLFGLAAVIVLYISNIIAVDRLMGEINNLQQQHQKMAYEQEVLRAQVNRLSSLERINQKAAEELGLVNPREPAIWMSIDPSKIHGVEQAIRKK